MNKTEPAQSAQLLLNLACDLYAAGAIGKIEAAKRAKVDFFTFQKELKTRNIETYSGRMLNDDLAALEALFTK